MKGYDLIWEEHEGFKDGLYLFLSKTDDNCIMNFTKDKNIDNTWDINISANEMLEFISTICKDQLYATLDRIIKIRKIKKRYGI